MSFQSVHDMLVPPGIVRKQKFWDFFDGDSLRSWWTFRDVAGTGSGAMSDTVDGGYAITCDTANVDSSAIDFNNIRHYSHNSSVVNAVVETAETTNYFMHVGFEELAATPADTRAVYGNSTAASFQTLITTLNTANNIVNTALSLTTSRTKVRIDLRSTSAVLRIDNQLEAISTSQLPDVKMQPFFRMGTLTTAAKTGSILYQEAFST